MPTMPRNEVHVVNFPNGHHNSVDCWCEPSVIEWVVNRNGVPVLVVAHEDATPEARDRVLQARDRDHGSPYASNEPGASWITRALTPPWDQGLLPPHDPNERSL